MTLCEKCRNYLNGICGLHPTGALVTKNCGLYLPNEDEDGLVVAYTEDGVIQWYIKFFSYGEPVKTSSRNSAYVYQTEDGARYAVEKARNSLGSDEGTFVILDCEDSLIYEEDDLT